MYLLSFALLYFVVSFVRFPLFLTSMCIDFLGGIEIDNIIDAEVESFHLCCIVFVAREGSYCKFPRLFGFERVTCYFAML